MSLKNQHMRDDCISSVAHYLIIYPQNQMIVVKQKIDSGALNICDGDQPIIVCFFVSLS